MIMLGCNLLFVDRINQSITTNVLTYLWESVYIHLHKYLCYDSKGFACNLWVVSTCGLHLFLTLLLQLCSWATIAPLREFYIASLTLISCLRWLAAWIKVLKVLNNHGVFKIFFNAISSCLSLSMGSFIF